MLCPYMKIKYEILFFWNNHSWYQLGNPYDSYAHMLAIAYRTLHSTLATLVGFTRLLFAATAIHASPSLISIDPYSPVCSIANTPKSDATRNFNRRILARLPSNYGCHLIIQTSILRRAN